MPKVRCPRCPAATQPMNQITLLSHLRSYHNVIEPELPKLLKGHPAKLQKGKKKRNKRARSRNLPNARAEMDQSGSDATAMEWEGIKYRTERRLDGSPDPWMYRENGRFGSHSAYDRFDDESTP
jgi:hypothetical protein